MIKRKFWKRFIIFTAVTLIVVPLGCALASCGGGSQPQTQSLTLGSSSNETDTLIFIADTQGYFKNNSLNVNIKSYQTGLAATDAVLKGDTDLSTAAEFVIAGKALASSQILEVGTITKFQNEYLIGRTDKGINEIKDLKGKTIGVIPGTSSQFYLGRFLELHGLSSNAVNVKALSSSNIVNSIVSGDVDAVLTWQPTINSIKAQLAGKAVIWPAQNEQLKYWNVVGSNSWVNQHPDTVKRFLTALNQSEIFLINHPNEVKTMIQKQMQYSDAYIADIWPQYQFSIGLDPSLITAMNDEARWMINNNLTPEKALPDFYQNVYIDGLKAVKPESVSIVR
jgi:NitT/TauT family transport system substrate-binding protein